MSNDKHTQTPIGYILLRSFSISVRENGSHNWKIMKGTLVPDYKKKRLYVSENSALEAISQMKTFYPKDQFKAIPVFAEPSETIATLRAEKAELIEALRAIIAQWDTPNWKLTESTGTIINQARQTLAKIETK